MPLAACWPLAAQESLPVDEPDAAHSAADALPPPDETLSAAQDLDGLLADGAPLPAPIVADAARAPGIGNEDVLEMVRAELSESTIIAAIHANETRFDVSPRALVELKREGVPESVLEAMLAAAVAQRQAAAPAQTSVAQPSVASTPPSEAQPAPAIVSPDELARLSAAIERLATQSADVPQAPERASAADHVPAVWLIDGGLKAPFEPTMARVAATDVKRFGSTALKTLQGLAGKALAFANPALNVASGLGGLFRDEDREMTAVWALLGPSSPRKLDENAVFEVMFGGIPGVNPDEYRPAIVQLVPTSDNYRLVGAARTSASSAGMPSGPIIEETVPARLTPIGRGHYEVALTAPLAPGEYALVLRPIVEQRSRGRRRSDGSLGELLGGGSSQVLYMTWDFSIGG